MCLLDLQTNNYIKCPLTPLYFPLKVQKHAIQAIVMGNDKRDELLVHGYIRQLEKSPEFTTANLKAFPELFNHIVQITSIEYMYVMSPTTSCTHWKIKVSDI